MFNSDTFSVASYKQELGKFFFAEKPQVKINSLKKQKYGYTIHNVVNRVLLSLHGGPFENLHKVHFFKKFKRFFSLGRNEMNGLMTKNQELQDQVRSGEEIRLRRAENLETSARDDLTAEKVRRDKQRAEIEESQEEIKRIKTTFNQGRLVYYCSRI